MPVHSKMGSCVWSSDDIDKWVVPDLSNVSEEEFHDRLKNLKRSHQKLLDLCDRVGIKDRSSSGTSHMEDDVLDFKKQISLSSMSSDDSLSEQHSEYLYQLSDPSKNSWSLNSFRHYNSDELLNRRHSNYFAKNATTSSLRRTTKRCRSLSGSDGNCNYNETWSRITTCVPFNMTIREEEKKRNNQTTRSKRRLEQHYRERAELENAKLKKAFKALPIPSGTSENLYCEMQENLRLRKQRSLLKRNDFFNRTSQPFTFLGRQKHKNVCEYVEAELDTPAKDDFKANPFPVHIYSRERDEKLRRIDILRQIRSAERSNRLLRGARSLSSMSGRPNRHKCHPPSKPTDWKRSRMHSGWVFPELANSPELRLKPDVIKVEKICTGRNQIDGSKATSQLPGRRSRSTFDRERHFQDGGRHRNCCGAQSPAPNCGVANLKPRPPNVSNCREARPLSKKRDAYWMEEKMKREIEAELEQITL